MREPRAVAAVTRPVVVHVVEAALTGCGRHVVDLVTGVHGVEHHVVVPLPGARARTDPAVVDRLRRAGAVIHGIPMRRSITSPRNVAAVWRVRRLLRRVRADVVHGHSSIGGVVARVAGAASRVTTVYTPNGIAEGRVARLVEQALARATDDWIAVSESERARAHALGLAPRGTIAVVPNGVPPAPLAHADLRMHLGLESHTPTVGTIGRLISQKAPQDVVALFDAVAARNGAAHFVVVGEGPLEREVDARIARSAAASRIHRIPYLAGADRYVGSLDVFVLLSRFEGLPYSALEAMRAGCAVVLTDVVGNTDVVQPGRTGLLVPPGDVGAAAEAVTTLLDDPAQRARLGRAAAADVAARFDLARQLDFHRALYRRAARR